MDDHKLERIHSIPVFANCDKRSLRDVAAIADEVSLEAGKVIVAQGSTLRHAYIVVSGGASADVDGHHVGDVQAGEVIGEIAMFDPAPASATVTTTEPTEVLVLAHRRFESVIRDNPDLAVALLRTLAKRFHATQAATTTHTHE